MWTLELGECGLMNGLNKRNHSIIDWCFTKIMKELPRIDCYIPLAWTVRFKNRFAMCRGYSSSRYS